MAMTAITSGKKDSRGMHDVTLTLRNVIAVQHGDDVELVIRDVGLIDLSEIGRVVRNECDLRESQVAEVCENIRQHMTINMLSSRIVQREDEH